MIPAELLGSRFLEDAAATTALGCAFGESMRSGGLLLIRGDLGAGKTTFIQGLARGLGVNEPDEVRSATFSLLERHDGPTPLVHVDLYRIGDPDELEVLELHRYLDEGAVVAVEWPDRGADWPAEAVEIALREDGEGRRITAALRGGGEGAPSAEPAERRA